MTRRSKKWDERLASDLKDIEFAREFIVACIEDEGINIQQALAKAIKAYGVKEFAELSGMASSNIIRAINPDHNPTQKTLSQLLEPFGLRLSVLPAKKSA